MEDLVSTPAASQQVTTAGPHKTELLLGQKVFGLLAEASFQADWDALYGACPWATVFQSRDFVATWYQVYRSQYQPVLVRQQAGGRLTGLLTLALDKSGLLVGAGDSQAEYQVWLSVDSTGEGFIQSALSQVRRHFQGHSIRLRYLPGNTPLAWIDRETAWQKRCLLRACRQPLLRIEEDRIDRELKKKNRREKINRLKRLGDLRFERVTDYQVFLAIFEELATQYDFRKGAMFNRVFFLDDPFRKEFLLALFRQNLLHATILRLNEEIIASNVGVTGKNWVHLQGINTHAPQYARYSPGILHFLMLGKLMAEEGLEVFDLTPGADAYKDALATDSGLAYELTISNSYNRLASAISNKLIHQVKQSSAKAGIGPGALKNIKRQAYLLKERLQLARQQRLLTIIPVLFAQSSPVKQMKVYRYEPEGSTGSAAESISIQQNSLPDLLAFDPKGSRCTRWDFLAEAMRRLEWGDLAFTWTESGRLLGVVWLRAQLSTPGRDQPSPELPEGVAVLEGFYCHPAGREQWPAFLQAVACRVGLHREQAHVYAVPPVADNAISQILKAAEFRQIAAAKEKDDKKTE